MRRDGELYQEPTQEQIVSEGLREIKETEFKELEKVEKSLRRKELEKMRGGDIFTVPVKRSPFGTNYFNPR